MIDRKHFKFKRTEIYKGYTIKIRKGNLLFLTEILDKNSNYVAHTSFRATEEEALESAKSRIDLFYENGDFITI